MQFLKIKLFYSSVGLDSILFAINIDNEAFNVGAGRLKGKDNSEENSRLIEPEPHVAKVAENSQSLAGKIFFCTFKEFQL